MIEFWNKRYASKSYAYGEAPNVFFKNQIDLIKEKGNVLFPAEGEGRNAVYAAQLGWHSFAFDTSMKAKEKAMQLAEKNNVHFNYAIDSFETYAPSILFDLIVLCYSHVPQEKRNTYFQNTIKWLKPNGKIILEGFSKKQFGLASGGPKQINMLFSKNEIQNTFQTLDIIDLSENEIELNEGEFHKGKAHVIRMIAQKNEIY